MIKGLLRRSLSSRISGFVLLTLALVALFLHPGQGLAEVPIPTIRLVLEFDGRPLLSLQQSPPRISCKDLSSGERMDCRPMETGVGELHIRRPPPGMYALLVRIDADQSNPLQYPGDYQVLHEFTVTDSGPSELRVNVPKLIHLTSPASNLHALAGTLGSCGEKPKFQTMSNDTREMAFSWDPVVEDAEYVYSVFRAQCQPVRTIEEILQKTTTETDVSEALPANNPGEFYLFRVIARKNGNTVGDLLVHDGHANSGSYRFIVTDQATAATAHSVEYTLFAVFVMTLIGLTTAWGWTRESAGSPKPFKAVLIAFAFIALLVSGRLLIEPVSHFVKSAQFQSNVNPPYWWDKKSGPGYEIASHGDLTAAWVTADYGQGTVTQKRRFIKAAYQAVVKHPDDPHLVAHAVLFMGIASDDEKFTRHVLEFGISHHFDYRQQTNNCVGCRPGDTMAELVINLARIYLGDERNADALGLIDRLLQQRQAEVSDGKLAQLQGLHARAYIAQGQTQEAISVLETAIKDLKSTAYAGQLELMLEQCRKEAQSEH